MAVVSGSGQETTVATAFASPLVVVVNDSYGNPVPGTSVTFTAPAAALHRAHRLAGHDRRQRGREPHGHRRIRRPGHTR